MSKIKHPDNEGYPIFITSTCFERTPFFIRPEAAELVIEQIDRLRNKGVWWVSEYVVMPDHVHLIVLPLKPLGYCLQEFKKSVARLLNQKRGTSGVKIWLDEYHARVIRSDKEYQKELEYIWWNPVKERLTDSPEKFSFSSANPSRKTNRAKFY